MAKKISEGVGKKIVEALKKQSEIEINPSPAEQEIDTDELESLTEGLGEVFEDEEQKEQEPLQESDLTESLPEDDFLDNLSEKAEDIQFNINDTQMKTQNQSFGNFQQPASSISESSMKELDNFEIPSNIAVLKKLISQLPSGVARHTGAQIIKQTMEALGISMKSVLQEAQQVQDGLNNSARECFATIQEYKKQIVVLEKQAQNYQKQYSALNELISLFLQTTNS